MAAAVPMDPNYPSRVQSTEMPSYGNLADFRLCDYETGWRCMQWPSTKRALAVYCTGAGVCAFVANTYFCWHRPDQKGFIHQGLTLSCSMNTHEGSWRCMKMFEDTVYDVKCDMIPNSPHDLHGVSWCWNLSLNKGRLSYLAQPSSTSMPSIARTQELPSVDDEESAPLAEF